jgi:hypothetical protein
MMMATTIARRRRPTSATRPMTANQTDVLLLRRDADNDTTATASSTVVDEPPLWRCRVGLEPMEPLLAGVRPPLLLCLGMRGDEAVQIEWREKERARARASEEKTLTRYSSCALILVLHSPRCARLAFTYRRRRVADDRCYRIAEEEGTPSFCFCFFDSFLSSWF